MKRKYQYNEKIIKQKISAIINLTDVAPVELSDYTSSFDVREKHGISFWDSLIVAAALRNDCSILYSEDMHNRLIINDRLEIVNPFSK